MVEIGTTGCGETVPRATKKRGGRDRKLGGGEDAPEARECHRVAVRSMARRRTSARLEFERVIRVFRVSKFFPRKSKGTERFAGDPSQHKWT